MRSLLSESMLVNTKRIVMGDAANAERRKGLGESDISDCIASVKHFMVGQGRSSDSSGSSNAKIRGSFRSLSSHTIAFSEFHNELEKGNSQS